MSRYHHTTLNCPVQVGPDPFDRCGDPIQVRHWPGDPASPHCDASAPEMEVIRAECGHISRLSMGDLDQLLYDQLEQS